MNEWINALVLSDSGQIIWNALRANKLGYLENHPKEKFKPVAGICNKLISFIIKRYVYLSK